MADSGNQLTCLVKILDKLNDIFIITKVIRVPGTTGNKDSIISAKGIRGSELTYKVVYVYCVSLDASCGTGRCRASG